MAPALGLLLVECCYDAYNDRWAGDGSRPRLQLSDWSDTVNRFKVSSLVLCLSGSESNFLHLIPQNDLPHSGKSLRIQAIASETGRLAAATG